MSASAQQLTPVDELPPKPSGTSRLFWIVLLLGVAATLLYLGPDLTRPHRPMGPLHPGAGVPLPALQLTPCLGTDQALTSQTLSGKVALINFWGTWCPPCREEFPHLMRLRAARQHQPDFQFVSVTASGSGDDDPDELGRNVAAFLRERETDLTVYCDPEGRVRAPLARLLKFEGFAYPTTLVVDRRGVIRGIWVGFLSGEERDIDRLVGQLLDEKTS